MRTVIWNGIRGLLDVNVKGYKDGNAMFYPENGVPLYRICIKVREIE